MRTLLSNDLCGMVAYHDVDGEEVAEGARAGYQHQESPSMSRVKEILSSGRQAFYMEIYDSARHLEVAKARIEKR